MSTSTGTDSVNKNHSASRRGGKKKLKWSHYSPGVTQRVGRGIALLFHDRGTRRGWVVSSMPWPHFTPGKDPVPILQEAGWAPGPVWTGWKSLPHRDSIPDCPAHSQSLYLLSYPAHCYTEYNIKIKGIHIIPHTVYTVITLAHFRNRNSQSKTKLCTRVLISP